MQADAPFWKALVFDGIDEVDVERVATVFGTVEIVARGSKAGAACPDCGHYSERVHGSYQRRLRDLPLGERSVVIAPRSGASSVTRGPVFDARSLNRSYG
ncbi:transposase family protein [Streptomyces phaeochromogenes]|uniref:transposase family protein n=1 Tax=Streptomyces phaeochromogenes TaxID=1923 RepID=UPI0036B3B82C